MSTHTHTQPARQAVRQSREGNGQGPCGVWAISKNCCCNLEIYFVCSNVCVCNFHIDCLSVSCRSDLTLSQLCCVWQVAGKCLAIRPPDTDSPPAALWSKVKSFVKLKMFTASCLAVSCGWARGCVRGLTVARAAKNILN